MRFVFIVLLAILSYCVRADEAANYIKMGWPLDQAEIVLIGEDHTIKIDRARETAILVEHSRPGDVLLLEGSSLPPGFGNEDHKFDRSFEEAALLNGLRIGGWDDEEAFRLEGYAYREDLGLLDTINSPDAGLWEKLKAYVQAYGRRHGILLLNGIRERHMYATIRDVSLRFPEAKIFVIAGNVHLHPSWDLAGSLAATGRKYAVLWPRQDDPERTPVISGAEYIRAVTNDRRITQIGR